MTTYFKNKAYRLAAEMIKTQFIKIEVSAGTGLFNHKCHLNSVDYALRNSLNQVVLCYAINKDNKSIVAHVINVNPDNKYLDNTLGYKSAVYDYYFVKEEEISDPCYDFEIVSIGLIKLKNKLTKQLPFLVRLFTNDLF